MLHSQHSKSNSPAVLRRALGFFSFFFGLVLIAAMALLGPPSSSSAASKLSEKTNVRISNRGGGSASVNPGQFAEKLGLTLSSAATVPPATITVDRTDDVPAAAACTVAPNDCSLRGAIAFANLNPGTTINIPAGTYNLTISGAGEGFSGNNAIGDLDITGNNTTIVGAGAASTIINQTTAGDRVIEVNPFLDPGFVTSISGVTISGGTESTGVGGGGIVSGAIGNTLTLTNCIVSGNSATGAGSFGGGGISHAGGNLVINGCTFTNNSTSASGGAVGYSAGDPFGRFPSVGTLTISGSSFSNNTSTSTAIGGGALDLFDFNRGTSTFQIDSSGFSNNSASSAAGGAIIVESGGPLTVSTSSFENNHAGTRGGAVYGSGTAGVVRFSRLAGNNVTTPTNGNTIFFATGTFTADDNWWGVNTGPSSNDFRNPSGSVSPTTFLQLRASASPNSICTGATSSISADIKQRNAGAPLTVELNGLPPFPATFVNATPSLGSLSAVSANFVDGAASATFTAGATAGTANIDVTADNQTVTASITVQTNTTTDPADQTVCQGGTATFSTTASGPGPITFTWKKGATVLNNGDLGGRVTITNGTSSSTLSISNVQTSDADTYTVEATGSCNTATQSATLTVNTPPVVTLNPQSQTATGGTVTFTAAATGNPTPTVQWQVSTNGGASFSDMPGETSTSLTVAATPANNGNQYRAVFTNTCGSATTTAATLTTCQAPVFQTTTPSISLWPPNHQYHTFDASSFGVTANSNCGGDVTNSLVIVRVSSDEPENNPLGADGSTLNDIIIAADCKSVQLRSERDGNLNGRVYTITFRASDTHGNSSTTTVTVKIPVNQNGAPAVDDGPGAGYTVNGTCP
jgi:predicted outer membrane repeat protein